MRAKRDWERVRSPHARLLEGLQAAVANHPSASRRVGATSNTSRSGRARLTVVGSSTDNVIPLPTGRTARRRKPLSRGDGGSAA